MAHWHLEVAIVVETYCSVCVCVCVGVSECVCGWVGVGGCHSPQAFQAWAWPAHPYDSFLAYKTGSRLLPGSCPTPLLGQGD